MQIKVNSVEYNPHQIRGTAEERFFLQVKKNENGCWEWQGYVNYKGYGAFRSENNGRRINVHRFAYQHFIGEIPQGFVVDHICKNTRCANPNHLRAVSNYDNLVLYGETNIGFVNANKKVCHNGHLLEGENLSNFVYRGLKRRRCKKCHAAKIARWRAKHVS